MGVRESEVRFRRNPTYVRAPRRRLRFAATCCATFVLAPVGFVSSSSATPFPDLVVRSQGTALQPITVAVSFNAASTPSGVTGYRAEALCNNVPQAAGQYRVSLLFPASGGTGVWLVPLAVGVSCSFRLVVLGAGRRPLSGGVVVGGSLYPISYPSAVDGLPVDANSVVETGPIPVEAPTNVFFGDPGSVSTTTTTTTSTTTTSTTTSSTTSTSTTSPPASTTTTSPPASTTTTSVPAPPAPPRKRVPTVAAKKVVKAKKKLVRICTRRVRGKCVATKLVRR